MKGVCLGAVRVAGLVVLSGCAATGASPERAKLVSTASFDHRCPEPRITIVSERERDPSGDGPQYELYVCGAKRRYKRAGTVFYDAETGGPLAK